MVRTRSAGISAIAFSVLTLAAFLLVAPPGGSYSARDVASFTSSGHRPVVVAGLYVGIAAAVALLGVVLHLRRVVAPGVREVLVLAGGGVAVVALPIGLAVSSAVPVGLMIGGGQAIDPRVTYMFSQAGMAVVFGVAFTGTGLALAAAAGSLSGWLRVATYVGAVGGLASLAFFPSLLLLLWGLVAGVALLRAAPGTEPADASGAVPAQTRTESGHGTRVG
jgi:hypothetical protein